jgi:uncharacterized protein (DUF1499 family)
MAKPTLIVFLAVSACILLVVVRWINSCSQPLHRLGVIDGRLADCPDSPNCVSTQVGNSEHNIAPIPFKLSAEETQRQLEAIIRSMPRSRIVSSRTGYFHAEFTGQLLGFVDDVEFAIVETEHLIHFRSASRSGRSDLGVNRKRMEQVRQRFQDR